MSAPVKSAVAASPLEVVRYLASSPLLTGPLLYLLTGAPADIRERALAPLRPYLLSKDADARIAVTVRILKVLFAIGIGGKINQLLDRLAQNYWYLRRPGAPWRFGDAQNSELVLITGGCSGFGYHTAKALSSKARVIVLDISDCPEDLERRKWHIPNVHYYKCDITDYDALRLLTAEIKSTHGNPSVLVNNAGTANGRVVKDIDTERINRIFQVNIVSHFVLIREFLPGMIAAQKGHIVTVASMASFGAVAGMVDYGCTKVAALFLNDGLRDELISGRYGTAGHGICTTSVHPSFHETTLIKGAIPTLNKFGIFPDPPTNVSKLIVEQILAGRSGRLFVPKHQQRLENYRGWPLWFRDVMAGYPWSHLYRRTDFRFSDAEQMK